MQFLPSFIDGFKLKPVQQEKTLDLAVQRKKHLSLTVEKQIGNNWCWAAVSLSIAKFFDPTTSWSQCNIAEAAKARIEQDKDLPVWEAGQCCQTLKGGNCDQAYFLNRALQIVGVYRDMEQGPANASTEIDSDLPLAVRVGWDHDRGGGHFLVIQGYQISDNGEEWYSVDDPIYGPSPYIPKSEFAENYRQNGVWTHSYFVQRGGNGLGGGDIDHSHDPSALGA